jgi:hypothetical protein
LKFKKNKKKKNLVAMDKHVIFTWIPNHIGIYDNQSTDHQFIFIKEGNEFQSKKHSLVEENQRAVLKQLFMLPYSLP